MTQTAKALFAAGALLPLASICNAAIVSVQADPDPASASVTDDGTLGVGEYAATYANGGGGGFGGTVGNSSISMDSDGTNLYIAFDPGASLNDNAVLYLDTRAGGVVDAEMNDRADGGRAASSNLTQDVDDQMPIVPDFTVVFGNFGTVVFELTTHDQDESTATDGHLNFIAFEDDQNGNDETVVREIAIPLATLGNPNRVDFFTAYTAGSMFNSNESLPFSPALNGGNNPGFDNDGTNMPVIYENANRFTLVPEPSSALLCIAGLSAFLLTRRR